MEPVQQFKRAIRRMQWIWLCAFLIIAIGYGLFHSFQYGSHFEEISLQQVSLVECFFTSWVQSIDINRDTRRTMVFSETEDPQQLAKQIFRIFTANSLPTPVIRTDTDYFWISEIYFDHQQGEEMVMIVQGDSRGARIDWVDLSYLHDRFVNMIQWSYPLILMDSNMYGLMLGEGFDDRRVDYFDIQQLRILNNRFLMLDGQFLHFRESHWENYTLIQLGQVFPRVLEAFVPLAIPFIMGIIIFAFVNQIILKYDRVLSRDLLNLEKAIQYGKQVVLPDQTPIMDRGRAVFERWNASLEQKEELQNEVNRLTKRVSVLTNLEAQYANGISKLYQMLARISLENHYDLDTTFSAMMETLFMKTGAFSFVSLEKNGEACQNWGQQPEQIHDRFSVRHHHDEFTLNLHPSSDSTDKEFQMYRELMRLSAQIMITLCMLSTKGQIDPKSGLLRVDVFMDLLEKEWNKYKRYHHTGTLCGLTFHELSELSDQYGVGLMDAMELKIGSIIRQGIRSTDLSCRFSNQTYLLFFLESDQHSAQERLKMVARRIVNEVKTPDHHSPFKTYQYSLTPFSNDLDCVDAFIQKTLDDLKQHPLSE